MSVFSIRKEFSDVNTPKTSISARTAGCFIFFCKSIKLRETGREREGERERKNKKDKKK